MTTSDHSPTPRRRLASRRQFLLGGAVAGVGAAVAIGADQLLARPPAAPPTAPVAEQLHGSETVMFHGKHQAGIETPAQAHATFIALDLREHVDRDGLRRLMRVLTDDAVRLTAGRAALADTEPELTVAPARLTVTFGFGPTFVARTAGTAPDWLAPLPAFSIDRLQPEFSDGDLLLMVASDDAVTLAHATRMLLKDARSFTSVRWSQSGFRRSRGTEASGTTMRNLFGQVDGTSNLAPGTADFDRLVWIDDGWLAGGTSFVLRRIEMNLDTWDEVDRAGREQSMGRFLDSGAPLTGTKEHDEPDFEATTSLGFPVIPDFSHVRRARSDNPDERILRRAYNYDDAPIGESISRSGLLFGSFQADVSRQFTPLQRRLDELDLLNTWTTPIGSAVFAIPPGCEPDGYIGETLLEA